jgi:hypothetical protein
MSTQIMTESLFERFHAAPATGEPRGGGVPQNNGPDETGSDPQSNGMLDETSNGRAADFRGRTYPPAGKGSLIRITVLGKRRAIPPIRIL